MSQQKFHGLTENEVVESRSKNGDNLITPPKDNSVWRLLFEKFNDPLIKVLLFAAALSLAVAVIDGSYVETVGIIVAIFLATIVGFLFEWDAMRRFKRLNKVNDDVLVKVIRGGVVEQIPRRDVVVGDVVCLENGESIPSDGTLLEAVSLRVNESSLTGELEVEKSVDPAHFDDDATYPTNMLLRGTVVTDGYCIMETTAVGDSTEAGRVTKLSTIESGETTPLSRQLTRLSKQIGVVGISLSVLIFVVLIIKGALFQGLFDGDWVAISRGVLSIFMVSVAVIVMAVPEGLPMSITLSLAMSMRRMLKTNNLVRKMHACETMGAVTVICTDKTGTLTQNKMALQDVERYADLDDRVLYEMIALNSTAFLGESGEPIGNPTEGALLQWIQSKGEDYVALRQKAQIIDRLTFTTERKYMATIVDSGIDGVRRICVKGAPEIVAAMCSKSTPMSQVNQTLAMYQNRAMRTLAVAYAQTGDAKVDMADVELTLAAVVAIADPVREDVPAAVAECVNAGIDIKIVTGDTPATAREIARQIGLWSDETDGEKNHITGADFEAMSDEVLLDRVCDLKIMSRARPLDKQRLVRLLQQQGEIVAVTGDGTNDAPALNFADVGLSMGTGTSVAKDASDITLLDDSFASIATAVMWGRSLYRNIQRFLLFQLTINFVAIVVVLFGSIFGGEIPLTVTQILWVNIIMDTLAALAMASLPPNHKVMSERPRDNNASIMSPRMIANIISIGLIFIVVLLGMFFYWQHSDGGITIRHLTIFFTTFVFLQLWNLFNAKRFESRTSALADLNKCGGFLLVLGLIAVGQILIVQFGGEAVFRVVPLSLLDWAIIIPSTSLIAIGGEVLRWFRRDR